MAAPGSIPGSDIATLDDQVDDFCINITSRQHANLEVLYTILEGKLKQNENMN